MTQHAGRLICPQCRANNFDTVTACWKCSAPLGSSAPMAAPMMPMASPSVAAYPSERAQTPQPVTYINTGVSGDSSMAKRAAIALALTIPFIGLPVGWVFMMIEDHRKQAIGRVCANWSLIGLVLHLLLMGALAKSSTEWLMKILVPIMQNKSNGGGGLPGGLDGM